MAKENSTIDKYRERLLEGHGQQLRNGKIPTSEIGKDWNDEHGNGYNGIFRGTDE